jgi:hypothetical protein
MTLSSSTILPKTAAIRSKSTKQVERRVRLFLLEVERKRDAREALSAAEEEAADALQVVLPAVPLALGDKLLSRRDLGVGLQGRVLRIVQPEGASWTDARVQRVAAAWSTVEYLDGAVWWPGGGGGGRAFICLVVRVVLGLLVYTPTSFHAHDPHHRLGGPGDGRDQPVRGDRGGPHRVRRGRPGRDPRCRA